LPKIAVLVIPNKHRSNKLRQGRPHPRKLWSAWQHTLHEHDAHRLVPFCIRHSSSAQSYFTA
jgi:hypothetical protein